MNIALVGRLGSGKSTAAAELVELGWARHSWADGVRDIFSMAFEQITPENYADIKARHYPVIEGGVPQTRTGRELLQRIGTDALRNNVDEDFWIKAGLRRLTDHRTVNDDTRFLNEAAALRERGFTIVRIVRPVVTGGSIAIHPSETEQERIVVDHTIINDGTVDALKAGIRFIAQGGSESLRGSRMAARWGCGCPPGQLHRFECSRFHEMP